MGQRELVVDTHCHVWQIELARRSWLAPEFGGLYRTFTPDDLAAASQPVGLTHCVLIEAGTTEEENLELERMAGASALVGAMVPFVDLADPRLEDTLDLWGRKPKFRGVRARLEGHPDPNVLTRPDILRGLQYVAKRGLVFEFLISSHHLPDVLRVYDRLPDLRGIIEHMAKPDMAAGTDKAQWYQSMAALAKDTRVACKLSLSPRAEQISELLAHPGRGWPVEPIRPYVLFLAEHFGPQRLMWGSDWPILHLVSDYAGTLRAMREALGTLSAADERYLFRETAMRFYDLR